MKLVTLGDVMVDVVAPTLPLPAQRLHQRVEVHAGGSAVNAARVARRLGAHVQVVGRVGNDFAGSLIASTLQDAEIDVQLARDAELSTGTAVALADAVVADRGANARLRPTDLPVPLVGDALLVSGFALFQDGSREAARTALQQFNGAWTAVDLASPALANGDFDARVVFATEDEAAAVPGLHDRFELVCMKDDYGVARSAAFGAGDAFAAAFLVALGNGSTTADALHDARSIAGRVATSGVSALLRS